MINWIWIPIIATITFIFGGIVGGVIICIPFSKALKNINNTNDNFDK